MSWGRIGHPTEMVKIDNEVEVMILHVDRDREKIALGLKQKERSPWTDVESKYPAGTKCKGEVVNVMSYGAFVKLEDGIEGLVHISEMSWTKRVNHPSELVAPGDEVEVVVLGINKDKQEISLGMKQAQPTRGTRSPSDTRPARRSRERSATSPITARSSNWKRAWTASCTSATCRGRARFPTRTKCSRREISSPAR